MDQLQIQAIVQTASVAFGGLFDFAFEPLIMAFWGPPFVLFLAINLIRVALGKNYAPGVEQFGSYGEKELRDSIKDLSRVSRGSEQTDPVSDWRKAARDSKGTYYEGWARDKYKSWRD